MNYDEALTKMGIDGESEVARNVERCSEAFDFIMKVCNGIIDGSPLKTGIFFLASVEEAMESTLSRCDDNLVAVAREWMRMDAEGKDSRLAKAIERVRKN